jgi:hypothetical protein
MTQTVSNRRFCLENSLELTRPAAAAFYQSDQTNLDHTGHFRLQQIPNRNGNVFLDRSTIQRTNESSTVISRAERDLPTQTPHKSQTPADPLRVTRRLPSNFDARTYTTLHWDVQQPRRLHHERKPFQNVAPLPRAQQISGYSGCIGGPLIQEIDNPNVDFQPLTIVRTTQPKRGLSIQ